MPVKLLNLDDRTFTDLVDEVRLLIPRHARSWTDYNYSDPGIMLVELFAWLTEALLYRINRVPDASRVRLLEMLGAIFRPAEPAVLELHVHVALTGDVSTYELPRRARIRVDRGSDKPVYFEVLRAVSFTAQQPVRTVTARQTQVVTSHALPQKSDDQPLQLWRLDGGFLVAPPEARPRPIQVWVDDEPWEFKPFLRDSVGTDKHFAFKPWLESLAFGNGEKGAIPADRVPIKVVYRSTHTAQSVVKENFHSNGRPWQLFRLAQQPLLLDLDKPGDLEPRLEVVEPGPPARSAPWQFVTRFLDMEPGAAQYVYEPWYNAVRFGDGAYGKIPAKEATVKIRYRQTLGAEGNIAPRSQVSFWTSPVIEKDGVEDDPDIPEESWQRLPHLKVQTDVDGKQLWEISEGHNPTTLDDARRQIEELLKPGWRAVTADDFVSIVQRNQPEIARVVCLPGHDPAAPEPNLDRLGHVGIIVIPRATSNVIAPKADLRHVRAIAASSLHLVARDANGVTRLWNMNDRRKITKLAEQPLCDLIFSPNGLRLLVVPAAGPMELWDANHGRQVTVLEQPIETDVEAGGRGGPWEQAPASTTQTSLSRALFSPDGQHLAAIHADGRAYLWETKDGVLVRDLGAVSPSILPLFSPDGHMLAAARGDNSALLWRLDNNEQPFELKLSAPVTQMAFSPDGARLTIAAADASARLCHIRPEDGKVLETLTLDLGQPVKALVFDPSGTRLVALANDGSATLWSSRTGASIASLSAKGSVDLFTFSSNGRWLATAHGDKTVCCWNAASGREMFTLSLTAPLQAVVFSPGGHRLVTISAAALLAHTLQAWDVRSSTGRLISKTKIPGRQPLAIHASGRWLAYADERLVHIWDTETSKDIAILYVDFDDPDVLMDGWSLVAPRGGTRSAAIASNAPIRLTEAPYLSIVSAVKKDTARRAVQVFDAEHAYRAGPLLATRRLVTCQTHVEGPTYTKVDIDVGVTRSTLEISSEKLAANIGRALSEFFNPLHGGPEGTGWPLGRPVYASEVYEVVEGVTGVDHVEHLKLDKISAGQQVHIDISPLSLVRCVVTVQVV